MRGYPSTRALSSRQKLTAAGGRVNCVDCNGFTAWVCAECSNGPGSLVAVCPEITKPTKGKDKGTTVRHFCLAHHCANPNVFRCGKAPLMLVAASARASQSLQTPRRRPERALVVKPQRHAGCTAGVCMLCYVWVEGGPNGPI